MVMNDDISRLVDGELDDEAALERAFADLRREPALSTWVCYHVIGETLRGGASPSAGLGRRFSAALAAEPTVLAPQRRTQHPASFAWAAAATVAAVAVVGWTALSITDVPDAALAKAREVSNVRSAEARPQGIPSDYLLAHQEYSPASAMQGVRPMMRAVSLDTGATQP